MAEVQAVEAPAAPVAPPVVGTPPADEKPAPPAEAPEAEKAEPAGEKPATPEEVARQERQRHRRQMNAAYRKAAEAQARADQLAREIETLKKPAAPEGAPKLEQFDFDPEKYGAAREKWAKEQAQKEFETKQRTEAEKQATQRLQQAWDDEVEKVHDKYEDFDAVVGEIAPTNYLMAAVMQAGPDVAYHLGKNQKEAQRIADLRNPLLQAIELGKLHTKLATAPEKPKTPSKAPAPITPVAGSAAPAAKSLLDPELSYDEFVKMREKELGRRK